MAGYKIGKATGYDSLEAQLNEIGMSVAKSLAQTWVVTFSDGTDVTIDGSVDAGSFGWFIADDDAKFLYMSKRPDIADAAETKTSSAFSSLYFIVAQKMDGTMIGEVPNSSYSVYQYINSSDMLRKYNSDASKNDLVLMPLMGNFDDITIKHVFKSLYINYHRWFSFGDIIVSSNGDRYIGIGWILHKIGGGIIKSEYNNAPLRIEIKEVQSYE